VVDDGPRADDVERHWEQNWKDATVRVSLVAHWDTHQLRVRIRTGRQEETVSGLTTARAESPCCSSLRGFSRSICLPGSASSNVMTGQSLDPVSMRCSSARSICQDYGIQADLRIVVTWSAEGREHFDGAKQHPLWQTLLYSSASTPSKLDLGRCSLWTSAEDLDDHVPLIHAGCLPSINRLPLLQYWQRSNDTPTNAQPIRSNVGKLLQTWLQKIPFNYEANLRNSFQGRP